MTDLTPLDDKRGKLLAGSTVTVHSSEPYF
jgi:hypothetical protein